MKKGLNNITLPVYKQIKSELPGIIKTIVNGGIQNGTIKTTIYTSELEGSAEGFVFDAVKNLEEGSIIKAYTEEVGIVLHHYEEPYDKLSILWIYPDTQLSFIIYDVITEGSSKYFVPNESESKFIYLSELGGTKLYRHVIHITLKSDSSSVGYLVILSGNSDKLESINNIKNEVYGYQSKTTRCYFAPTYSYGTEMKDVVAIHLYSGGQYTTYDGVIVTKYQAGNPTTGVLENIDFSTSYNGCDYSDTVTPL